MPRNPGDEHTLQIHDDLQARPNETTHDEHTNLTLAQMIARQAAATPMVVALVENTRTLSYGKLDAYANQLANYLCSLGMRPQMPVGICLDRSIDLVVGLLGILKAGCAYVALDPAYPAERLAFMIEDVDTRVVLTNQALAAHFTATGRTVICIDDRVSLAQYSMDDPEVATTEGDLAYVVYTSGSTGRPKGVLIEQRGLRSLVAWHQRAFAVTAEDRATQVASPAFDALGWEIWPYLACGARIHIVDEETRVSPVKLRDWLVTNAITISFLPTVLAESVLRLDWPEHIALRSLLTGADLLHSYPDPRLPFTLFNNYGPAEATVVATSGVILPSSDTSRPPTIGRPIDNVQVYLLDEQRQLVPPGMPGEICIGGAGVARGYLNHPQLTAERFVPDLISGIPGARLYKTGDLARVLPDGQIEFIGRNDFQIKIRGIRIEPHEIETILCRQPGIQASIVEARDDAAGEKHLIAYLVTQNDTPISARALRASLAATLPEAMVPSAFVRLDALPISLNGKIDRSGLPAPDATNTVSDDALTQPTNSIERRVASIVTQLLHIDQIDMDDNFFLLGGNSLMGAQIIAQITECFAVDLPLRTLFERPTVRLLASEVEECLYAKIALMSEDEARALLG